MAMDKLSGELLFNTFVAGGSRVIENQANLNKINVFPVPDGDTGSNLAQTFHTIMENGRMSSSAGETMRSIAEQALIGSRGNSGIIFAQFFYGLSESIGDTRYVSLKLFKQAVKQATERAYEALSRPVEGTVLTVMREWSEAVSRISDRMSDFTNLFGSTIHTAAEALKRTPQKLKVLQKAHVVDAGAEGFVHFLSGALEFIRTRKLPERARMHRKKVEIAHEPEVGEEALAYRYCTEVLLEGQNIDLADLRHRLQEFGDSLIVAGSPARARVHIHTNAPSRLTDMLRSAGTLVEQKVDDMVRQQQAVHDRKYAIALVTDSVCDLPPELLDRYQIHQIPLTLSFGENHYLDKYTISADQVYTMLDAAPVYPTTSQPSVVRFNRLYGFLAEHYDSIIAVHLSSHLSGTWSISRQAAGELEEIKVSVIDSKHLSGSLGLIVLRAAEAIDSGKSHEEVVAAVQDFVPKADNFVSVQTLEYMVRGGRVSPMKGVLSKLLNLKPIVSMNEEGRSVLYGKAFSRRKNKQKIIRMVSDLNAESPLRCYAVVHAHAPELAAEFCRDLEATLGMPPLYTMDISPIVGLNAGLGAVSVVTMKE